MGNELSMHYVSTYDDAEELVAGAERFWVSPCGCREGGDGCKRSRHDVCLGFTPGSVSMANEAREISRAEAEELTRYSRERGLVVRPFRDDKDKSVTEGICFCCDCCCGYFLETEYKCDPGRHVERTDLSACNHCGVCEPACFFGARVMENGKLLLVREKCGGCGMCVDVCPEACVVLTPREAAAAS
jgi:ferredoxin